MENTSTYEYNDIVDIKKARERQVIKHNDIVRKAKINLSANEQKMMNYIISLIKPPECYPGGIQPLEYQFKMNDYCKICGMHKGGDAHDMVKDNLYSLCDKGALVELDNKIYTRISWLSKFYLPVSSSGELLVRVVLDRDLAPYIFNLRSQTTRFDLYNILALKSKYSLRMYELCKSWSGIGGKFYKPEELMELLEAPEGARYSDFKRNALDVAKKEINKHTDINIDYDFKTKGRKVIEINVKVSNKTQNETNQVARSVHRELDSM